jgi:hypothetical protein
VAELRQEIAGKLGNETHVFSRTLYLSGEPLHNQRFCLSVAGKNFELRK